MSAAAARNEFLRWTISGLFVVLAHAGAAVAFIHWHDFIEDAEPAAAIVIELAPLAVSRTDTLPDVPPGPEQVEGKVAPTKPVEKKEEPIEKKIEPEPIPNPVPEVAPAPNPEVAVASERREQEVKAPPAESAPAPAPVTTAPPPALARAAVPAAPTVGAPSTVSSATVQRWHTQVVALLERNKRYPSAARSRREQGLVQLSFELDRAGRVVASHVVRSSGSPALDQEALDLVRRAQPFPPPPVQISGALLSLTVPIRFNIR